MLCIFRMCLRVLWDVELLIRNNRVTKIIQSLCEFCLFLCLVWLKRTNLWCRFFKQNILKLKIVFAYNCQNLYVEDIVSKVSKHAPKASSTAVSKPSFFVPALRVSPCDLVASVCGLLVTRFYSVTVFILI